MSPYLERPLRTLEQALKERQSAWEDEPHRPGAVVVPLAPSRAPEPRHRPSSTGDAPRFEVRVGSMRR